MHRIVTTCTCFHNSNQYIFINLNTKINFQDDSNGQKLEGIELQSRMPVIQYIYYLQYIYCMILMNQRQNVFVAHPNAPIGVVVPVI